MNKWLLALIMIAYAASGLWGMGWGLYSEARGEQLFPTGGAWNAQRVADTRAQVAPAGDASAADVDPDPRPADSLPAVLNSDDDGIAEIYARYLLYSAQPDEMITFRALGRMDPAGGDFDPRMYQYGGAFVYPIGALVKAADLTGWAPTGGLGDYLTGPSNFAKYYLLGRGYVVAWGVIGLWVLYVLAARLADWRAGLLAALLFALLPVVVTLSHEAKPHLPGAVLMLLATLWAVKYIEGGLVRHRVLLALTCGLAAGMVLSGVWILLLIPLAECLTRSSWGERLGRSTVFGLLAVIVYGLINPYVVVHLLGDRAALAHNLANSTAMYHAGNLLGGMANAWHLLIAGSSLFLVIAGLAMLVALWGWDWRRTTVLALPALLIFAKLALFGEGKPAEYARFTVFPAAMLCVLAAVGVFRFLAPRWYQGTIYGLALASAVAWPALSYYEDLHRAGTTDDVRFQLATRLAAGSSADSSPVIGVLREPAPYNFPPVSFADWRLMQLPPNVEQWPGQRPGWPLQLVVPLNGIEGVDLQQILDDGYYRLPEGEVLPDDRSPISWANKPLVLLEHRLGGGLAASRGELGR